MCSERVRPSSDKMLLTAKHMLSPFWTERSLGNEIPPSAQHLGRVVSRARIIPPSWSRSTAPSQSKMMPDTPNTYMYYRDARSLRRGIEMSSGANSTERSIPWITDFDYIIYTLIIHSTKADLRYVHPVWDTGVRISLVLVAFFSR